MMQWLELETLNQAIRDQISVESKFILICNERNILKSFKSLQLAQFYLFINYAVRFYGVMVSTQDTESCDPSSSLGRTLLYILYHRTKIFKRKTKR